MPADLLPIGIGRDGCCTRRLQGWAALSPGHPSDRCPDSLGVEALIAGSPGQDAPAGEVRAQVLPDGGCGDGRGRQHVCEPVQRIEDLTNLPVFPWQGGCRPSMSSRISANHEPCSTVARSRGTGSRPDLISGSRSPRILASCRCRRGVSGLTWPEAALTNQRRPSPQTMRAARPGLNPPGAVAASTTGRRRRARAV